MKYYEGPEELKDVIESYIYIKQKNIIRVYLLNGMEENIYNADDNEEKRIQEIMLKQLIERNENINIKPITIERNFDATLFTVITTLYAAYHIKFEKDTSEILTIITLICSIILSLKIKFNIDVIKDINKSKLFLDMYEELQTPEGQKVVDSLDFNKIFGKELNINTLDTFKYSEVKQIHKKLKKSK